MNHWQDIVVGCAVASAVLYLGRLFWLRLVARSNACGNACSGCPSGPDANNEAGESSPLTIQPPTRSAADE